MTTNKDDHPALNPLALIVNDIYNRKVQGSPRSIAEKIINLVFAREADRWEDSETVFEGGVRRDSPRAGTTGAITQTGSQTEGTHHRKVLVFYGPWEEGSPRVPNGHPLTGEMPERPGSGTPPHQSPPPNSGGAAAAFRDIGASARAAGQIRVPLGNADGGSLNGFSLDINSSVSPSAVAQQAIVELRTRQQRL